MGPDGRAGFGPHVLHPGLGDSSSAGGAESKLTNESGFRGEVSDGHRDLFDDVLANHLDVVLELSRDGNDGRALRHRACGDAKAHQG